MISRSSNSAAIRIASEARQGQCEKEEGPSQPYTYQEYMVL